MPDARTPAPPRDDIPLADGMPPDGGADLLSEDPSRAGASRDGRAYRDEGTVPRSRRYLAQLAALWLGLPVADIVHSDSGLSAALPLAAVVAFGGCFLRVATTMRSPDAVAPTRITWLCTALIVVLAVVMPLLRRDVEWTCFQVYGTVTLSFMLPLRQVGRCIAAGVATTAVQSVVRGDSVREVLAATLTVFGLSMSMLGLRRSRLLVRRLRDAQGEVARLAAVEERLRIARDLHDLVGHSLSLIVVKSELAGRLSDAHPRAAAQEIADVESVARQSLVEVRDAVTGYRQRSFIEELDDARSALAAAGVDAVLRPPGAPLPGEIDQLFGWAVREGVTNVIRHARAGRCEISASLGERGRVACLDIVDDGAGPGADGDADADADTVAGGTGNGLAGLAERVAAAGGRLSSGAAGRKGRGFRLTVRVPVTDQAPPADPAPPGDT